MPARPVKRSSGWLALALGSNVALPADVPAVVQDVLEAIIAPAMAVRWALSVLGPRSHQPAGDGPRLVRPVQRLDDPGRMRGHPAAGFAHPTVCGRQTEYGNHSIGNLNQQPTDNQKYSGGLEDTTIHQTTDQSGTPRRLIHLRFNNAGTFRLGSEQVMRKPRL